MAKMTMVQALNLALRQEMENDDSVILLGEDVGVDGGVFRVTDALIDQFGEQRVLDTPLAETAIVGMSIGMAVYGLKPVCEIQFSGFSYQNFHQVENHAARLRWRSQGRYHVPMVLRTPYGGGVRALEHHSESREVYRAFREEVPEKEEVMPIGKSQIVREGQDLTMISYGAMMRPTLEAASALKEQSGVEAEVIDLLTISPLDDELFVQSVLKTGRAVVVHEAPRSFGPAGEIIARLMEKAFFYLEAPVERVTGFDVVMPLFSREKAYLPDAQRILTAANKVLAA